MSDDRWEMTQMNEERLKVDAQEPVKKPGFRWTREFAGGIFFLLVVLIHVGNSLLNPITNATLSIIVTQLLIVVPAFLYMLCLRQNPFRFMRFRKFHIGSFFLIPVFMLCLVPVIGLLNAISMLFTTNIISGEIDSITGGYLWSGLLFVAMVPAFVEETAFRGALYHSLRGARPVRAIILSALMFGAMHMNFNQFVYATALGIVMGFLLEATGSIVSTMVLHFCFNAQSVILLWLLPKLEQFLQQVAPGQYEQALNNTTQYTTAEILSIVAVMLPLACIGGALAFLVYYCIARLNGRWYYICFLFSPTTKEQRDAYPRPKLVNVPVILGFVICFVICVVNELYARGILRF